MVLGCGAVYAARTVIPLVIPDVAAELGWSSVLVGYVLSFFFWGYALTQVSDASFFSVFSCLMQIFYFHVSL